MGVGAEQSTSLPPTPESTCEATQQDMCVPALTGSHNPAVASPGGLSARLGYELLVALLGKEVWVN